MPQELTREDLARVLQTQAIDDLSVPEIFQLFREEKQLADYLPDAVYHVDPRDGALITYSSKRARRPHDYQSVKPAPDLNEKSCPICEGTTTGVIDVAELSQGFTVINKNLLPIPHALEKADPQHLERAVHEDAFPMGQVSYGLHFLQWTSSLHDKDWHNMPLTDREIVLQRLATLEKKLLFESEELMPISEPWNIERSTHGFVSIIKNYGSLVGGSLSHGHQQIAFSNIMPKRFHNNWSFFERKKELFSAYMLRENPPELLVRDYGEAKLIVPYFMRRPYDMMLILTDFSKQYLCELTPDEMTAVAEGWHDAIRAILDVMPRIGKETAYNVTVNNGPGAGLYTEVLPYTQQTGGFEHLGLWVCQNNPQNVASQLREFVSGRE
jgi:galactose-1-phosphate uridylyltransferase